MTDDMILEASGGPVRADDPRLRETFSLDVSDRFSGEPEFSAGERLLVRGVSELLSLAVAGPGRLEPDCEVSRMELACIYGPLVRVQVGDRLKKNETGCPFVVRRGYSGAVGFGKGPETLGSL